MKFINHRINSPEMLAKVPFENGIEVDVRYHNNDLVLHHDPFHHHETSPPKLDSLLREWKHSGPLILNVKTEGIERACIELMNAYKIQNWFFLDLSMPYFVKYSEIALEGSIQGFGPGNLAVRFSEKEPIEYALSFSRKARWVWIDCFTHLPLNAQVYEVLKKAGFDICLVSPELQGLPISYIQKFREQIRGFSVAAVCTKRPDRWGQSLPEDVVMQLEKDCPFE